MAGKLSEPNNRGTGRQTSPLQDLLGPTERRRDLRRLPQLLLRAFRLVWQAAPRQLLLSAALQVAGGLSLAGQLLVAKRLMDLFLASGEVPALGVVGAELVLFSLLFLLAWVAGVARGEQQQLLGELVERHTTRQVMEVSTAVPLIRYDDPQFYDRLERARINASVRPIQIVGGLLGMFQTVPAVIAVGGALFLIQPTVFALMMLGSVPAVLANRVGSRLIHRHQVKHTPGDRLRRYLYVILSRKEEAQEIRAFDSSDRLCRRHDEAFDRKISDHRVVIKQRILLGLLGGAVSVAMIGVALVLLVTFVGTGHLDLASAGTALGALFILSGRLRGLLSSIGGLYEGSLFLEDFTSFLDQYHAAAVQQQADRGASIKPIAHFNQVQLHQVSFTYPSRTAPSLRDISLRIQRGEVIALVGENGSGKTTLAKLLAGLYSPGTGRVLWDGVDLRHADPAEVREQVAVIFQDYARYFLTARENIGIGDEARMEDDQAIADAAQRAGAHDFLSALPQGYDSMLGPAFAGGSDLSVGQWQRVALARAHFRDAPFLILDEPTASLDPRGEYQVFEQVRRLATGRTVLLISHRFSSARSADRILVLDSGRLTEEGTHEELMARAGLYAELFTLQARAYGESLH